MKADLKSQIILLKESIKLGWNFQMGAATGHRPPMHGRSMKIKLGSMFGSQ